MSDFGKDFKPFIKKAEWLDTFYPPIHAGPGRGHKTGADLEPVLMPVTKKESARALASLRLQFS